MYNENNEERKRQDFLKWLEKVLWHDWRLGGKLQESVKKRKEVKDWEDGHPKMSPNQLSRKEKIQMKLAE